MSTPVNQVMLGGDTELPDRASLSHYADAGTRAFLAAYAPADQLDVVGTGEIHRSRLPASRRYLMPPDPGS
jgi:hypothetical protein